ncbi:MAG: ABC transporter ATP-binding protein [Bacilli bacterium]|nr:ABC transporter ATP-binding protein [Bacilli bacterium]
MKKNNILKDKVKRIKSLFRNFKRTWKFVKEERSKLIVCLILSGILCLISAITPLLSAKLLLNLTEGLLDNLLKVAFFILIVELTRNIGQFLYGIIFNKYMMNTVSLLQYNIAKETLRLETFELDKKSSGVFIDRLNNDSRDIVNIFNSFGETIIEVVTNIGVLLAIFFVNKIIFIYYLLTMIILFMLEKMKMKKFFEIDKKRRKIQEKNTGMVGELVRGIRDIKVLNSEKEFLTLAKNKLDEANDERYKMQKVRHKYTLIVNSIKDLSNLIFIALGIYLININNLEAENFVVLYMYKDKVLGLLRHFVIVVELMKEFNVSADRVFEIIEDEKFSKEKFGDKKIKKAKGNFEFKDVSFSYTGENPVLKNISFKIKANETVSFVGKSGSGKSTIFNLMNKLYTVDNGEILLDGININSLDKDSIRNNISVITQSPYIFNMSIRDNLKIVKEDMTEEEMIKVSKIACLHDFVMRLPDGYDTVVGEGGLTLSGGERQRLAITRALLKKTEIILFDEATSALDNETQEQIQTAINNMKGKYTILIIAHRLSTVIDSDKIILIDDGKVIDEGSHNELLKTSKTYKKLYEKELR